MTDRDWDAAIDAKLVELEILQSDGASMDPATVIAAIRLLYEIVRELRRRR